MKKISEAKLKELKMQRQLYFDGIRYSILMIDMAYKRLYSFLLKVSETRKPSIEDFTSIYQDTWSIIDCAFRLRILIILAPGVNKSNPNVKLFLNRTKKLEVFRHFIQHIDKEIQKLVLLDLSTWGSLSWYKIYDQNHGRIYALKAGSVREKEIIPQVNPFGKKVTPPLDLITLNAANDEICLSNIYYSVSELEKHIKSQLPLADIMADILITLDINTTSSKK